MSPYHGGSHAAWAEGLRGHSEHDIELLTLPDRFWKWRMHGGAATLARRFLSGDTAGELDVILTTDMLDVTTFLALTRRRTARCPLVLYMHENQLTYPLPDDPEQGPMRRQQGERDRHYAFVNYASMLAADRVVFNSRYHLDAWFDELPRFLRHFPEYNELGSVDAVRDKSSVLPVGIDCPAAPVDGDRGPERVRSAPPSHAGNPGCTGNRGANEPAEESPLLLWNQRWEYDKNPAELVRALRAVSARGVDFRLALCGQSFHQAPPDLAAARRTFAARLVHYGFAEPGTYRELLRRADVAVSTASHEFFGVAVLEAMAHGACAVLPGRLSYPELLAGEAVSDETRRLCLYTDHEGLVERLFRTLTDRGARRAAAAELAANARRFCWPLVAPDYDRMLRDAAG